MDEASVLLIIAQALDNLSRQVQDYGYPTWATKLKDLSTQCADRAVQIRKGP